MSTSRNAILANLVTFANLAIPVNLVNLANLVELVNLVSFTKPLRDMLSSETHLGTDMFRTC